MALALLAQGKTAIRDSLKTLVTHVCVSNDGGAFVITDTGINPAGGTTNTHVEASTDTDVDGNTFDASITITGTTEFTNSSILAIGLAKGLGIRQATGTGTHTGGGIVGTDTISRTVRAAGLGIGVQSGDTYTLAVRVAVQDNS